MTDKLGTWVLDYIYAIRMQIKALRNRTPPTYPVGDANKPPVILIPGVYETWLFMKPIADALQQAGHSIFFVEELGYHTMEIVHTASAVRRLVDRHHLINAVVIAHSKGGLVGKYALLYNNRDRAITRLIAIATPFSGSIYAGWWLPSTIRALSPRNALVRELQSNTSVNAQITSIYAVFDPNIPDGSHLEGATNLPILATGHFRILGLDMLIRTVLEQVSDITGS
jgi:triacylglycerol lipase